MKKRSAGLLLFRQIAADIQILLVHPGGPFWAKRDDGAWSIPKGEYGEGENALAATRRECVEELGEGAAEALRDKPDTMFIPLGEVRQKAGKAVTAFAIEADFDVRTLNSNTVEIEWPPRSGKRLEIPEVDRAQWFSPDEARRKLNAAQAEFIGRLLSKLSATPL
jgi:predicted NUDIX family NTP pyrophosphohydrolase